MAMFSPHQLEQLHAAVLGAFDQAELEQLCRFKLGQTLNVIVNTARPFTAVVFDLLDLVERRGWTEEFVRGVYEARRDNPAVVQFCQAHATLVFTPRKATNELAQTVSRELAAVASGLASDGRAIRDVLFGQAHQNLADLVRQFTWLRQYKILHDCLHSLQFKYARLIATFLKSFVENPEDADNLVILFAEMADELAKTRPEAQGLESRDAENVWLNAGEESVRRMRAAVGVRDPQAAAAGCTLLEGLLRVQPTRINELLTGILGRLDLDRLRSLLVDLDPRPAGDHSTLADATAALGSLTPRVRVILAEHRQWQLVDNGLVQIDTELRLGSPLEQCAFLWTEVDKLLQPILDQDPGATWSEELRQLASDLHQAFRTANVDSVKTAFRRLRPRAMWFFFQADAALKKLSTELDQLGGRLKDIFREGDDNVAGAPTH
jgi:hypothetical protein